MKIFHTVEKVQKCVAITANRNLSIIYRRLFSSVRKKGKRKTLCNSLATNLDSAKRMPILAIDQCKHTKSDGSIGMTDHNCV
jgi:hypothetical protein